MCTGVLQILDRLRRGLESHDVWIVECGERDLKLMVGGREGKELMLFSRVTVTKSKTKSQKDEDPKQ